MFSRSSRRLRPAPLLPRPENWYSIKRVVALYMYPLDKHGRRIAGVQPSWWLVPRWLRDLYEAFAEMGRKDGAIFGSYDYIAGLMGVTAERARQQVQAMVNIGWAIKQHRTNEHGWYDTNLYGLVDPLAPKYAMAIVVRTDDRKQRYKVIKLSQQIGEIPEFSVAFARRQQRQRQPADPTADPVKSQAPMVILPELYRKIAEAEGLTDPRWQSEAWRRFEDARKHKGNKIKKPGAYWRGLVRHVREESKDQQLPVASMAVEFSEPEKERQRRRNWILGRAMKELMGGTAAGQAAAIIYRTHELLAYCRETACSLEEIMVIVAEAERALAGVPSQVTA